MLTTVCERRGYHLAASESATCRGCGITMREALENDEPFRTDAYDSTADPT